MTDLQSDINNIYDWFNRNRLSVNVNKSCTMSVPKRFLILTILQDCHMHPKLSIKELHCVIPYLGKNTYMYHLYAARWDMVYTDCTDYVAK